MAVLLVGGIATVNATTEMNKGYNMMRGLDKEDVMEKIEGRMEITEDEIETAMTKIPETYEEAKELVKGEIVKTTTLEEFPIVGDPEEYPGVPILRRFILWTHDGVHVMWGEHGNGYFVGEDNEGMEVWGIYQGGTFAGFYGDEFFHGMYRGNRWVAMNLFGEEYSFGRFELFPKPRIIKTEPMVNPIMGHYGTMKPEIAEAMTIE